MDKTKTSEEQNIIDELNKLLGKADSEDLRRVRDAVLQKTEPQVLLRNAKASVFTDLFSEPDYQRDLYKSLTGQTRETDEFRTITMENYLIGELHNDLGFLVGDELVVLCEAQSTWNVNIVYRILCYLVLGWKRLQREQGWDVFSTDPVPLPEPRLYVIYTGKGKPPDTLKLSDVFFGGRSDALELTVNIIRKGGRRGDILDQYQRFTEILDEAVKERGRSRETAEYVIRKCIKEGVLVEYLTRRGMTEMVDMLCGVFDEEEAQELHMKALLKKNTAELEAKHKRELAEMDAKHEKELAKEREGIILAALHAGVSEETLRAMYSRLTEKEFQRILGKAKAAEGTLQN